MPKHLAIGQNAIGGIESFLASKTKDVLFPKMFASRPKVDITIDANSVAVPYRINVSLTGFTIKFNVKFTGNVEWKAFEI